MRTHDGSAGDVGYGGIGSGRARSRRPDPTPASPRSSRRLSAGPTPS
ncbi:hypothetical protein OIE75_04775 [Streptomyces sp. NBC_01723]|nr:hypothetical protein [Streptomyces sp. NBC_01723]